ncbi:MAG: hypothetical protein ACO3UU_03915, partial [Minisyncoccia bacterium]
LGYQASTNTWQNVNVAIPDGDKGDITTSGGGSTWTIDNNAVTNAKLAQVATATVKGRATAGTGNVEDLTIDADLSSVSANDDTIPSAKAVKAYVDILDLKTRIRNGGLINGYIIPSVASNNLTLAVSTSPSSVVAPTSTNPVYVWIGNTLRSITSSLSISANAGTNWFNSGSAELATREIDYFAYIGYNATDGVVLGYARIPYARLYSDFNTTTTNEKYARISTITNAVAGDNYVVVGRFAATLSASASFNWSVPTFTNVNLIQEPIYETRELLYTPTLYGLSGSIGTFSANPYLGSYSINRNIASFQVDIKITNKGSWSSDVVYKTPIFIKSSTTMENNSLTGYIAKEGTSPVTANKGFPFLSRPNNLVFFLISVNTSGLTWAAVEINDVIRVNGQYYI